MRLIICLFIFLTSSTFAQEARVVVNKGPGTIFDFDFSPDSKFIATGGWDKYVRIWDCESGMEIHTLLNHTERVLGIAFSPDGNFLASAGFDSIVNIWDAHSFKLLHSFNANASVSGLIWDYSSSALILGHTNGEVSIWRTSTWKLFDRWKAHNGYVNDIMIAPNGSILFTAGEDSKLTLWQVSDHNQNQVLDLPAPVQNMLLSPTADRLLLVSGNTLLEVFDYPTFDNGISVNYVHAIKYLNFPFYAQPCFSRNGKILAYSDDQGHVILTDLTSISKDKSKAKILTIDVEHTDFISKVMFSPDGKYMASAGFDKKIRLSVFNGTNLSASDYKNGEQTNASFKELKSDLDPLRAAFYFDPETLCMMGANTYYFNVRTGEQKIINPYYIGLVDFKTINTPIGKYQYNLEALGVWKGDEIATWTIAPWTTDLELKNLFIVDGNQLIRIDPTKNSTDWNVTLRSSALTPITNTDGTKVAILMDDGSIHIHSGEDGRAISKLSGYPGKVNSFEFNTDGSQLLVTYFEHPSRVYNSATGKLESEYDHGEWGATSGEFSVDGKYVVFSTFKDKIQLFDGITHKEIYSLNIGHYISDVSFNPDASQLIYTASGCAVVLDLKTRKELLRHFPLAFKGIVTMTMDFYYMAPSFIEDELAFYTSDRVYPMEQFDLLYNRPDKVLARTGSGDEAMIAAYRSAYLKRLERYGGKDPSMGFNAPEISIEDKHKILGSVVKNSVTFTVMANDKNVDLDRINILINDVSIYGKSGISISGRSAKKTITLDLASGKNEIQVSVVNKEGIESFREKFTIFNEASNEPELYVIGIGASKFKDEKYNLTYASKDVSDFVNMMSKNKMYDKVHVKTLLDNQVTRENVSGIKSFFEKAERDDMVIIFVAGHGVLDIDYTYYFCSYDMDFNNPAAHGISYSQLEDLLDGIAPLKKLLFMDTCHSGEVDKDDVVIKKEESPEGGQDVVFRNVWAVESKSGLGMMKTTSLMKNMFLDLRKGTGATVISSAGGAEYAMESAEWKNGLFTYCLLTGFQDKASDLNGDGQLMLSELQVYISAMVTKLSQGKQSPTSRIMNNEFDYRIR